MRELQVSNPKHSDWAKNPCEKDINFYPPNKTKITLKEASVTQLGIIWSQNYVTLVLPISE